VKASTVRRVKASFDGGVAGGPAAFFVMGNFCIKGLCFEPFESCLLVWQGLLMQVN
jgi:hypothetical protein